MSTPSVAPPVHSQPHSASASPPVRVLLVDDDPAIRRGLGRVLRQQGFDVHEACGPQEAVSLGSELPPHLVIVDLHMPGMNGFELAVRIKEQWAEVPIVLITGDTHVQLSLDDSKLSAIVALLYKPIATDALLEALERARHRDVKVSREFRPSHRVTEPRFLIIEDDLVDQSLVKVLLRKAGFNESARDTATSLDEGAALMAKHRYSHILANCTLPGHRPQDVVVRLQSLDREVPLLILADEDDPELATTLIQLGADGFVVKDQADGRTFRHMLAYATERKAAHRRLVYASSHDPVTGLANAQLFRSRLAREMAEAQSQARGLVLVLIKWVELGSTSATLGSINSEQFLRSATDALASLVPLDRLAAPRSDCFAAILPLLSGQDAGTLVQTLAQQLRVAISEVAHGVAAEFRVGAAAFGSPPIAASALLRAAEDALDEATKDGRVVRIFDEALGQAIARRQLLRAELNHAIARGEIFLHYQPKIDLHNGHMTGVEALMRWRRQTGDLVSPAEFIPMLERSGQIVTFGQWALRVACSQSRQWLDATGKLIPIAVNLSGRQFHDSDLIGSVAEALEATKLPAIGLQLEVTESTLLRDRSACVEIMTQLKRLGVSLAIDDFGTGYSSMAYLKQFPFDFLKVDKSFVQDLETDPKSVAVVNGIVGLGRALGMRSIAEGIETAGQLARLRAVNCEFGQGYFLGRPVAAEAVDQTPRKL